jgi:ABC-type Fe3+/spermidine/putrescine transport system ATPase subunit
VVDVRLAGVSLALGGQRILRDLELRVRSGTCLALIGRSGSGKTTCLRLVAGLATPDQGTIEIDGRDVTRLPPERRGVAMVFQGFALFPHLDVAGNVSFGLELRRIPAPQRTAKVGQALARVGLAGFERRRIASLSGGQQQRVALARALVLEPTVLLLDEPLANLDVFLREEAGREIRRLQRELSVTALYVTHDRAEALAFADEIAVLDDGNVIEQGAPAELYAQPKTRTGAELLGRANFIKGDALPALGLDARPGLFLVRPETLTLSAPGQGRCRVVEVLFKGSRAEVLLSCDGHELWAEIPAALAPLPGAGVSVRTTIDPLKVQER